MGNQQQGYSSYNLNYDATNDSGFFDDEVFENELKRRTKMGVFERTSIENYDEDALVADRNNYKKFDAKQRFPKSKSIEIVQQKESQLKIQPKPRLTGLEIDEKMEDSQNKQKSSLPMRILTDKTNQNSHNMISSSWSPSGGLSEYENSQKIKQEKEKAERKPVTNEKGSSSANSTPTQASSISSSYSRSWLRGMNYIGKMAQGVKSFYNEMNPATLTGAIDVVVVKQRDGTFKSSPFHVRFGKMALIKTKDLTVDIEINGQPVDLHMRLGDAGEAYFVDEYSIDENDESSRSTSSCESLHDSNYRTASIDSAENEDSRRGTLVLNEQELINNKLNVPTNSSPEVKFFSDGEITPEYNSPRVSRPTSPNSDCDTVSRNTIKRSESNTSEWNWKWGEMPEKHSSKSEKTPETAQQRSRSSMLRRMGSYSNTSESERGNDSSSTLYPDIQEEIYLDDTEKLNSELAAIYINQNNESRTKKPPFLSQSSTNSNKESRMTRLTSEQLAQLNLNSGANEIIYSVTTALQGTTRITSYIFLWNYDDKVVVSDIDGTITKSDVWGQVLPIFGRDWTQAGVADLYSAIEKNQYKFMYLSARAIGQSRITRDLLKNVNQGGLTLPKGPLLVTPTSLFTAFQKEVIEKKPEEFKISCLRDVRSLFPEDHNPFYAGYGNKTSDVTAYKTVGIPVSRIFTINPQGELKHEVSRTFQSSYSNLCDFVDLIFPPLKPSAAIIKAEYDSFNFWRNNHVDDSIMAEIELELKNSTKNMQKSK